jgi:hypothetical protein
MNKAGQEDPYQREVRVFAVEAGHRSQAQVEAHVDDVGDGGQGNNVLHSNNDKAGKAAAEPARHARRDEFAIVDIVDRPGDSVEGLLYIIMRETATAGLPTERRTDSQGRSRASMEDSAMLGPKFASMVGVRPSSTRDADSACVIEGDMLFKIQSSAAEHFHGYGLLLVQ